MTSLEFDEWNGRWRRIGVAASLIGALFLAWTSLGSPKVATQSYHDEDVSDVKHMLRIVLCESSDIHLTPTARAQLECWRVSETIRRGVRDRDGQP